jgi:hypothetical protein
MVPAFPPNNHTFSRPLELKPDMAEAARRWDAWFAGGILDRPIVCVTSPKGKRPPLKLPAYRERVFGDMDESIHDQLCAAAATHYAGEATPWLRLSFGPDEIAVFCGAQLAWSEDSGDTNWSVACVSDWAEALPVGLIGQHPLYRRMLTMYSRAVDLVGGKMLLGSPDLHTNMDLLAALRGPQRLCADLLDCPEVIDRAMADARAVFRQLWDAVWQAGRMAEIGYVPTTTLQCDFSCMVSPAMSRRWIIPALEEEAAICGHVTYHWDGPGALVHLDDLCATKGLAALDYVPGAGRGSHLDYLDLFKRIQSRGKAVSVWGSVDEVKAMHRELRPELTIYHSWVGTPQEADGLVEWFVQNT